MRLHLEKRTVWRFLSDLVVLIVGVGLCWARGGVGPHAAARPKSTSISNVITGRALLQGGEDPKDSLSLQVISRQRDRGARRQSALARGYRTPTGSDQSNDDSRCSNTPLHYYNTL